MIFINFERLITLENNLTLNINITCHLILEIKLIRCKHYLIVLLISLTHFTYGDYYFKS